MANIPERLLGRGPQFQSQEEVWKPELKSEPDSEPEFEPESEPEKLSSKMKHQDYCCDDSTRQAYEQYYTSQAGSGLPGFQGLRYQRGHGLGSLFWGLVGVAAPLLKKGAIALGKSLGQKALKAGGTRLLGR